MKEDLKKFKKKMYLLMIIAFIMAMFSLYFAITTYKAIYVFLAAIIFFGIFLIYTIMVLNKKEEYNKQTVYPVASKYLTNFMYNKSNINIREVLKSIWHLKYRDEIENKERFQANYQNIEFSFNYFRIDRRDLISSDDNDFCDYKQLFIGKMFSIRNNKYVNGTIVICLKSIYEDRILKVMKYPIINFYEDRYVIQCTENVSFDSTILSIINELNPKYHNLIVVLKDDYVYFLFEDYGGLFNVDILSMTAYDDNIDKIIESNANRVIGYLNDFKRVIDTKY